MITNFNEALCAKVLEIIHEASELHGVAVDLDNINRFLSSTPTFEIMVEAKAFNIELHQKYPTIDEMLNIANSIPSANTIPRNYQPCAMEFLKQDYFGIICDTALKKGFASSIEEFIER